MTEPTDEELDDFVRDNDIDDRAADDLRNCSAEIQRKVLARGGLGTARNPSAALLARIRDARSSPALGGASSSLEVEDFIKLNNVDESAADMLRSASPTVQRNVIGRGELKTARNPSSALLSRIRDAKHSGSSHRNDDSHRGSQPPSSLGVPPMGMPAPSAYGFGYGMYPGYAGYPGYPGYPGHPQSDGRGYPGGPPVGYPGFPGYPGYPPMPPGSGPSTQGGQDGSSKGGYSAYGMYHAYSGYYGPPGACAGSGAAPAGTQAMLMDAPHDKSSRRRSRSRSRGRKRSPSRSRSGSRRSSPSSSSSYSRSRSRTPPRKNRKRRVRK